jgi:hypothetical protein
VRRLFHREQAQYGKELLSTIASTPISSVDCMRDADRLTDRLKTIYESPNTSVSSVRKCG